MDVDASEVKQSIGPNDLSNQDFPAKIISNKDAVLVTNAKKSYGRGKYSTPVLNNFNMTVQQGTIYSLLGSSGCGKTTLLSSIIGQKKLDAGKISVYGFSPGTRESGVPGKRVGYMPQEIALVGEFSIQEMLRYFGRLYGMNSDLIKRNGDFLIDFLKLPSQERRVDTLSGGQKRRVSFAVALIHNPELLILDEPTVGVDPLLRKSIWSHLTSLTSSGKTTVIITTHYIEEARGSDRVGLMRNGRLLTEDSPEALLKIHDTDLLEHIVLQLCLQDNSESKDYLENEISFTGGGTLKRIRDENENEKINIVGLRYRKRNPDLWDAEAIRQWNDYQRASTPNIFDESNQNSPAKRRQASFQRLFALSLKNVLMLTRNLLFLLFLVMLPAVQVILICAAIGSDSRGMKLGIVNKDVHNLNSALENVSYNEYDYQNYGCIFHKNYTGSASLHYLSLIDNFTFTLINYDSEEEALRDVKLTQLYGYMHLPENFTECMKDRLLFGATSELEAIFGSRINLHMDMSNKQVGAEMKFKFYQAFSTFLENYADACSIEQERFHSLIYFTKPVYGTENTPFTEFVSPSILIGILFFFPLLASGVSYIKEEKSGVLSRSQVAGVTKFEIMISYSVTNFVLLLTQTGLAFSFMILLFGIKIQGSLSLAIAICLLVGIAGISVGFLYTTFLNDELQVLMLSQGTFFPNFIISGMIWPTMSMPKALQYFAFVLPCTLACETIRSIISRGVGINHIGVWPGFVTTILWILLYWAITVFLSKRK